MFRKVTILTVLVAALASAQSGNSSIAGVIKDATGAPVPGAQIKITNQDTGVAFQLPSNDEGLYRVSALVPGKYQMEIEATGFDHLTRGPITLEVGQTLALDATLSVGRQSDSVDVVEQAPVTESQSSTITQQVNREM